MHEKIYMDKYSLMPKKRKDLFINRNIVTSRKRLKRIQMICDYMRLMLVTFITQNNITHFLVTFMTMLQLFIGFSFFQ